MPMGGEPDEIFVFFPSKGEGLFLHTLQFGWQGCKSYQQTVQERSPGGASPAPSSCGGGFRRKGICAELRRLCRVG